MTTFIGAEFIRRLNLNHLTTLPYKLIGEYLRLQPGKLFFVDEKKVIFCGPEINDGCKTT